MSLLRPTSNTSVQFETSSAAPPAKSQETVPKMSVQQDATLTSPPSTSSTAKPFFDLPAELRNKVYHCLFSGQKILIEGRRNGAVIQRDRKLGCNILLTGKGALAEAKPVLLSQILLELDLNSIWLENKHWPSKKFREDRGYPKEIHTSGRSDLQGLCHTDLTLVHAVDVHIMWWQWDDIIAILLTMPRLYSLSFRQTDPVRLVRVSINLSPPQNYTKNEWNRFLERLGKCYTSSKQALILEHLQQVAQQEKQPAQLLYKWAFKGVVTVNAELVNQTIWVVSARDETKILMPKRVEPELRNWCG
ncbi:hypothetical protein H2200_010222 [Cladophialophora chaetospira]|uniref:Uncharacterized protein n=1 Tax=Cladophialophora chaetospira TaxID=386627 RepID=A0AA38X2G7_9EURO|nr:hypothetical protein H2200_010222 [Cladophialophora chaetospira]